MKENGNQKEIWLALAPASTLFRLNTGRAWISNIGPKGVHRLKDGTVQIVSPRSIAIGFGMVNGSPVAGACDLPGWTTVVIDAGMVGRKVAVFTSIECKRTVGGMTSPEQLSWMNQVRGAGGIAGVANSPQEAKNIIADWYGESGTKPTLF